MVGHKIKLQGPEIRRALLRACQIISLWKGKANNTNNNNNDLRKSRVNTSNTIPCNEISPPIVGEFFSGSTLPTILPYPGTRPTTLGYTLREL